MIRPFILGLIAGLMTLQGCFKGSLTGLDVQQFVTQQSLEQGDARIGLTGWQDLLKETYPDERPVVVVSRFLVDPAAPGDDLRKQVAIQVGPLSQKQFEVGKRFYGSPGTLTYQSRRVYRLSEFLHPQIQALLGHRFEPTETTLKALSQDEVVSDRLVVADNCVSVAYEYLRGSDLEHVVFFALPYVLDRELRKRIEPLFAVDTPGLTVSPDEFLSGVPVYTMPDFERPGGQGKAPLQSGDLVMIYVSGGSRTGPFFSLHHAAIWIDDGLYFEKPSGTGQGVYRLLSHEMLRRTYQKNVRFVFARKRSGSEWPHPSFLFKSDLEAVTRHSDWSGVPKSQQPEVLFDGGDFHRPASVHMYRSVRILESAGSYRLDPKSAFSDDFFRYHPPK